MCGDAKLRVLLFLFVHGCVSILREGSLSRDGFPRFVLLLTLVLMKDFTRFMTL